MRKTSSSLRSIAEARLPAGAVRLRRNPTQRLEHELDVLKLELEMQNEALSDAQLALAASRDRYLDLYEFAPVAYLTLTTSGQIVEINLTGATLLGEDRSRILRRRFSSYVQAEDRSQWREHFVHTMKERGQRACVLRVQRQDGTGFNAHLSCLPSSAGGGDQQLRIALTDITEQLHAAQARRRFENRLNKLTKREREVLALALAGKINKHIAELLAVSLRTVENHRSRIHHKTGVVSLLELAHQAAAAGVRLDQLAPVAEPVAK